MSEHSRRYLYKGHAVGVAAQFDRLGPLTGLDHVVPAQASAVLPVTGGLSHTHASAYSYAVADPWKRTLVSVCHAESKAHGRAVPGGYRTDVYSRVEDVHFLEKMHIRRVELHLASEKIGDEPTKITSTGNHIEGLMLGNVQVTVELDQGMMGHCASRKEVAAYCAKEGAPEIRQCEAYDVCTLVRKISYSGPPDEVAKVDKPEGNMIHWPGFGRIYLAEVLVGDRERRITMIRLAMGSDSGGSGSVGDGSTNGSVST